MKSFTIGLLVALVAIALLTSCGFGDSFTYETDVEKREELFFRCLDNIPEGPVGTRYNDWDDVVEECGHQAYKMSTERVLRKGR